MVYLDHHQRCRIIYESTFTTVMLWAEIGLSPFTLNFFVWNIHVLKRVYFRDPRNRKKVCKALRFTLTDTFSFFVFTVLMIFFFLNACIMSNKEIERCKGWKIRVKGVYFTKMIFLSTPPPSIQKPRWSNFVFKVYSSLQDDRSSHSQQPKVR